MAELTHDDVRALREAFDQGFARAIEAHAEATLALLFIELSDARYAVRASELAGVELDRRVIPMPTPGNFAGTLLGIAGIRGRVVAVHSLAVLLGLTAPSTTPRGLLLSAGAEPFGFAFDRVGRYVTVRESSLLSLDASAGQPHVREWVSAEKGRVPLLGLSSIVRAIESKGES